MSAPQSLPSPPFIPVAGMLNCRDLGGLPVAGQPGKITRHGLVFRSADPSKLTDDGVRTLQGLGITHVYDLRSTVELEKARAAEGWDKPKEWEGAARVFAPVFLDQDYSPGALAIRFRDVRGSSCLSLPCASRLGASSLRGTPAPPQDIAHDRGI